MGMKGQGNRDVKGVNIHEGGHNIRMINGTGEIQGVGDFTISGNINVGDHAVCVGYGISCECDVWVIVVMRS